MDFENIMTGSFISKRVMKYGLKFVAPPIFGGFVFLAHKFPIFTGGDVRGDAVIYGLIAVCLALVLSPVLMFFK